MIVAAIVGSKFQNLDGMVQTYGTMGGEITQLTRGFNRALVQLSTVGDLTLLDPLVEHYIKQGGKIGDLTTGFVDGISANSDDSAVMNRMTNAYVRSGGNRTDLIEIIDINISNAQASNQVELEESLRNFSQSWQTSSTAESRCVCM